MWSVLPSVGGPVIGFPQFWSHGSDSWKSPGIWMAGTNHFIQIMLKFTFGYGSIPIHTIFRGMNIHLPAILMFTRGLGFWPIPIWNWGQMNEYDSTMSFRGHGHHPNYPLVMTNIAMEHPNHKWRFSWENHLYINGQFFMAMLNNQRVSTVQGGNYKSLLFNGDHTCQMVFPSGIKHGLLEYPPFI